MSQQWLQDIATLTQSRLLSGLATDEIGFLLGKLTLVTLGQGSVIDLSTQSEPALHFILEGQMEIQGGPEQHRALGPGDTFGEEALADRTSSERTVASSEVRLARLSMQAYAALAKVQPQTALHVAQGALRNVVERCQPTKWRVAQPAAAATTRTVDRGAKGHPISPTACVAERLPAELGGSLVVAGRQGERLLGLQAQCETESAIVPITTRDWEGRDIYRRSAGLVLLEAGRQLGFRLQLGPSITSGRLVLLEATADRAVVARALDARFAELSHSALPIEEELCPVRDAIDRFRTQDDGDACLLLEDSLESLVTLYRFGETWASVPGPLLPDSSLLQGVRVVEHPLGLLLDFGPRIRTALPRRSVSTMALEISAPRYGAPMTRSETEWLKLLGVQSVGTFNRACVQGRVDELIRVSEGFHEKRVAEIADGIKERGGVQIVAVAGPSSSGKTTFIKRLLVQLRVDGIEPIELSLDDYYRDRASQARDARGEIDFEALESLNLQALRADLEALLRGDAIRPPRYDFQQGVSHPQTGAELRLNGQSVLLLEGIHALNPELYGSIKRSSTFKVFIHPATSLAFDRLSSLEPADVRLLRRIVRDRHQRGFATSDTLSRWASVRSAERLHIFPFQGEADTVFDTSLVYEVSVLRVYAERYLLEVPRDAAEAPSARRLRRLLQLFVPIHPDHVPPSSLLREFIGGSGFSY